MTKIVYNACFGGFALSREAVLRAREISGNPKWGGACTTGDVYNDGNEVTRHFGFVDSVIPRHDPVLVQVVEELGAAASGEVARLQIAEVPSGSRYRIDEYDGRETVIAPDDYDWIVAP